MIENDLEQKGPAYGCRPPCAADSVGVQPAQGGCDSSGWAKCIEKGRNELKFEIFGRLTLSVNSDECQEEF